MHEDKLKQILKKVNAIPDLNSSNVIDKIKDILQKEDSDAYAIWEQNSFQLNVNFEFSKPYFKISTIKRLSLLELVVSADCDNVLKFLVEASKN
ncbi:hypothetical protein [Wolbachia endosymbiont (group E) of Neria commutata]|uniref:hypothetical protein n=1 Tax=Wolbachia endosymbiont (group E) of Neria commutata TaxID=3066149 RepID=UPI0031332A11